MKNSLLKTAHIGISLVCSLLFLFTSISNAQTSCDAWDYGLPGGFTLLGDLPFRLDQYCTGTLQDTLLESGKREEAWS